LLALHLHSFALYFPENRYNNRTVQERLGHTNLSARIGC